MDQNLNLQLSDVLTQNVQDHPQMMSCRNIFVRGNTVRSVGLASKDLELEQVQDVCKREMKRA